MTTLDVKHRVDRLLTELTEMLPDLHIQVLATWNEGGSTRMLETGSGNWYARQGLAHSFIEADRAQEHAFELGKQLHDGQQGEQGVET